MKGNKRYLALLTCIVMLVAMVGSTLAEGATEVISEETATLRMYGPGLFAEVGETGNVNIVTGVKRPGYEVLVKRWNELYPNVTLVIDAVPWDNWKAAIQTAALSGNYDILIHGNGNADFCLDMTDYLAQEPEIAEQMFFYPLRRNPDNMTETKPYGLSYTANAPVCAVDLQILEHYGIEAPTNEWTWDELAAIAEACTGTDPVTGQQTYGLSMIPASNAQQNYIVLSRAFDNVIFDFSEKLADCVFNFDTEKTYEVLNFWKQLGQYQSPDYAESLDRATAFTAENNLALIWDSGSYNNYNTIVANGQVDRFMYVALPKIMAGEYEGLTSSNMADLNISIYNKTEQKDLAWAFLKFLTTDPVAQQWLIDTYSIPNNLNFVGQVQMPSQYLDAITYISSTAPAGYNSSASKWYDSTWFGTLQSDVIAQSDLLLKGSKTAEEVAKYIQNSVDSYLKSLK